MVSARGWVLLAFAWPYVASEVLAHHFKCGWDLGTELVHDKNWVHFCSALLDQNKRYVCKDEGVVKGRQVADWNYLRKDTLEFGESLSRLALTMLKLHMPE